MFVGKLPSHTSHRACPAGCKLALHLFSHRFAKMLVRTRPADIMKHSTRPVANSLTTRRKGHTMAHHLFAQSFAEVLFAKCRFIHPFWYAPGGCQRVDDTPQATWANHLLTRRLLKRWLVFVCKRPVGKPSRLQKLDDTLQRTPSGISLVCAITCGSVGGKLPSNTHELVLPGKLPTC